MDPIFTIITLLLFAVIALAAWLLVYWVLHDPLPHVHRIDTEQPTVRRERAL
jgi:sensor domain CHASE-containing protein